MKIGLVDIISKWLNSHKRLKQYYKVYRYKDWPNEWPDILEADNAMSFIGTKCDGIQIGLAIMDDYVYYRNTSSSPKIKMMASDPDFFKKVAHDLTAFHKKIHKNSDCNISV